MTRTIIIAVCATSYYLSRHRSRRFHGIYTSLMVVATVGGVFGLLFKVYVAWGAYSTFSGTSRRVSLVGPVNNYKTAESKKRMKLPLARSV